MRGVHRDPYLGFITPTALPVGSGSSTSMIAATPVITVSPGDYFELYVYQTSGGSLALRGARQHDWRTEKCYSRGLVNIQPTVERIGMTTDSIWSGSQNADHSSIRAVRLVN